MTESYKPSPEEMADAESHMNPPEKISSMLRSRADLELVKECKLRLVEKIGGELSISGTIKGHEVLFVRTGIDCKIDNVSISPTDSRRLYGKYLPIAEFQSQDESIIMMAKKFRRDEQNKFKATNLVNELL